MEYTGDPPWMDLDNLAKAILDAIKGYVFHDDAQVGRLLVERQAGERERITVRVTQAGVRPISSFSLIPRRMSLGSRSLERNLRN